MAKEIKYDGSEQEMLELGFITEDGVAISSKREELNLYLKEVTKRNKYRDDEELINLGIVDKNGKVLDEKRLKEIEDKRLDESLEEKRAERDRIKAYNKTGLFKSALQKIIGRKKHKDILEKTTGIER